MVPRRYRGDRFLRASARRLPTRRQTRLHKRRLNSSLRLLTRKWLAHVRVRVAPACNPRPLRHSKASANRDALILSQGSNRVRRRRSSMSSAQRRVSLPGRARWAPLASSEACFQKAAATQVRPLGQALGHNTICKRKFRYINTLCATMAETETAPGPGSRSGTSGAL
jgi:hypothetical protein